VAATCGAVALGIGAPLAQAQQVDWLTAGGDPQLTAWQCNETIQTKDNVRDMKLFWKIKLDNKPRQMPNLFPPLICGQRHDGGGRKGNRHRGRRVRQHLRHRRGGTLLLGAIRRSAVRRKLQLIAGSSASVAAAILGKSVSARGRLKDVS
jgi:hypothetical protein